MERTFGTEEVSPMTLFLYILCAAMILNGLYCAGGNWYCFYLIFIKKTHAPSWLPLIPGALMFFGFYFFPGNPWSAWAWIAFFLDWGSVPGISHALLFHLWRYLKSLRED
jgi:hypothetical protein